VILTLYNLLYDVSPGIHLSCTLLASVERSEMKGKKIMGYTCHPPIRGYGRHASEITP
jgi:hypothetical protein